MGEGHLRAPAQQLTDAEPVRRTTPSVAKRRRVLVSDARSNGKHLRVTWHRERGLFVVSIWQDDVCAGTVQVPLANAPELIGLFVDGLAQQAARPSTAGRSRTVGFTALLNRLRQRLARRDRGKPPSATLATVRKLHG